MIYLLCIILIFYGEWRWAILALRLYREVKRINNQDEAVILQPCKKCGEYPEGIKLTWQEWFESGEPMKCECKCGIHILPGDAWAENIRWWNNNHGTLDELELKMIREGVTG